MSAGGDSKRRRIVMWLAGLAAASAAMGALSLVPATPAPKRMEAGQKVLPAFAGKLKEIGLVMVTTPDETYHIALDGDRWVLTEKGRYPVRSDLVDQLSRSLSALAYDRAMTRDERKFPRLGLGDPLKGQNGALVEVSDGNGEIFAKLIIGRRNEETYVRTPDDLQAWAVTGPEPPPLFRAARWLDLAAAKLEAADIAEVEVRFAEGPGYRLNPADAEGARFTLAPPLDQRPLIASYAATPPALAMTRLLPEDVTPASEIRGAQIVAEHVTRLKSGLELRARLLKAGQGAVQGNWITLEARTLADATPDAVTKAAEANARAAGWAFGLSEIDWTTFATPLAAIVQ